MISRSIFRSHRATLAALVLLSVLGVSVALADDDPPGRVARLSYADGSVSLQPAGVEDWADATINRPLTTGDKLWTDQNSRAELDIGSAAIRMGSTTGLSFLNLDDRTAQLNVTAGTAIVHVRELGENQSFEVDTPNVAVLLESPGDYRVEVNDAGNSTVVKVSDGDAQVSATGQTVPLHTQQAFAFNGTDQVTADRVSVGAPDGLDSWSIDRDHRAEEAQARVSQYVSPDVAGADDLAQYGTWESTPEYGQVWTPTAVAVGWSPYQDGRWVWVSPWGWTWVDAAPWGFAPFHYGRWAYYDTRWCWVPGPRQIRPVYAPALVAWVGSPGASVSISVGGGAGVGWFPLAPREVYVPAYRVSNDYVRNVNISNTTIVNNTYITNVYENRVSNITYANRNRPGAVVAVPQDVFTSARPISGHTVRIPQNQLQSFAAHTGGPAIVPVRESVLGRRPDVTVRRPPAAFVNRPVVARTAPPPAPVSFDRLQEAIRANGGRPLGRSQVTALQPQATAASSRVRVVAPGPIRPIENGQRFGTVRPEQGADRPQQRSGGPGQRLGGPEQRPGEPGRRLGGPEQRSGGPGQYADRPDQGMRGPGPRLGQQPQPSLPDRERALHATPIPPSSASQQGNAGSVPGGGARPGGFGGPGGPGVSGAGSASGPGQGFHTDRPPAAQMRNDQYRLENNGESRQQAQEVRPVPRATPIPQQQGRPFEQPPRAVDQPREQFSGPQRTDQAGRPFEQPRVGEPPQRFSEPQQFAQPRATPVPQQAPVERPRTVEEPRAQFRAPPEPPRAVDSPQRFSEPQQRFEPPPRFEQPRATPTPQPAPFEQPRPVEQPRAQFRPPEPPPRAAPPPPPRAAPPPQSAPPARGEERRTSPPNRQDQRTNRL